MEKEYRTLEFDMIISKLKEYALTGWAKEKFDELRPYMSEAQLESRLRETSEARKILDEVGTPPLISMNEVGENLMIASKGGMLTPSQLEYMGVVITGIRRLRDFLGRCKYLGTGIAYFGEELCSLEELQEMIEHSVRGGRIDDHASPQLRDVRRNILKAEEKIKERAERMLKSDKEIYADRFVVTRNSHICLPVKKEYKFKIDGSVIDKSSTGATLFIEPTAIAKMNEELFVLKIEEENEERKILYLLTAMVENEAPGFEKNMKIVAELDHIFAKGKLSASQHAIEPKINTERYIKIEKGRHPLLEEDKCIPLDFEISKGTNGIVITGPNTGGKTVAIKTVGLFSLMAQCGLHIPCSSANMCMNSQVLCDIGDGQNISENLSTFSAHITNVLDILKRVNNESLVIMDELGSGTDPAEGMGIAIAILQELKKSGCMFIATTHYPEVKIYAEKENGIENARMAFDRNTLRPLYQLEIGKAGESCALHIARQLGMPEEMIQRAEYEAYKKNMSSQVEDHITKHNEGQPKQELEKNDLSLKKDDSDLKNKVTSQKINSGTYAQISAKVQKIQKKQEIKIVSERAKKFCLGDSVFVYPENKIGIVAGTANENGEILVQIKKKKILVNHKRLKLNVAATELYPEDYDFSIIFDTVENRKARHKMGKRHQEGLEIHIDMRNDKE